MVEHEDVVADPHDDAHVVLDEQDREAEVTPEPIDETGHGRRLVRVHPRGRLVEQQQGRLAREGARQLEATLVAVGQVLRQLIVPTGQPDQGEPLTSLGRRRFLFPPLASTRQQVIDEVGAQLEVHPHEHVLERRHVLEEPDVLERPTDARG